MIPSLTSDPAVFVLPQADGPRSFLPQNDAGAPALKAGAPRHVLRRLPLWYTESGSPRFCDFHPIFCADSEADEAALVRLCCEHAKSEHDQTAVYVALTWSARREKDTLCARLTEGNLKAQHAYCYGSPPPTGIDAPLIASGIEEMWVREHGVWLKLDDMLCASIPFLTTSADDFFGRLEWRA